MLKRPIQITTRRWNSSFNLQDEIKAIAKARYLKESGAKYIFPKSTSPASKIFPSLESIDPKKDLQTRDFHNTKLGVYYISKTTTGRVPVYSEIRRGLARETIIRRVEGDVVQLKKDLQAALPQIDPDSFKVLQESKKIVIRGDWVGPVRKVLEQKL